MPVIKANGIDIYYETRGEGTPLMLINGWGGNLDSWSDKMIDLLAEKQDKPDTPYTMDMIAADTKGVLDSLGITKTHVMGFSMGGAITQTFGINYPETVLSLVICGASAGREN